MNTMKNDEPKYPKHFANGQLIADIIMEHAVMREAFRALVDGDEIAYCAKYGLEYDDVYRTIEEAIYERVEHMCYLSIMEGDLDPNRGDKLRMKRKSEDNHDHEK